MFSMEDVFVELTREDVNEQGLPPGFRFHPTDEELITFYLASKVFNGSFSGVDIAEIDLNRCEPWELPDVAKMGEREWYFFSLRDRKYPTGLRTNRATGAGYWKATGKDREVHSASNGALLGMKKTLVFYRGRAPRGEKTKWVMHEYRLDGDFSCRHTCKEEWVICRIYQKTLEKKSSLLEGPNYMLENCSSPSIGSLPQLLDTSTPPLLDLDCQPQPINPNNNHNPFIIHNNENNPSNLNTTCQYELTPVLKTLMSEPSFASQSPQLFPINCGLFQPPFPHTINASTKNKINTDTNIINNTSPSMLFKSLLSHQDFALKEQANTMPKQCKTEANFYHFQPYDNNLHWMDKIIQPSNPYQHQNQNQNKKQPLIFEFDYCSGLSSSSSSATADTTTAHEMSTSFAFNRTNAYLVDPHIRSVLAESWPLDS